MHYEFAKAHSLHIAQSAFEFTLLDFLGNFRSTVLLVSFALGFVSLPCITPSSAALETLFSAQNILRNTALLRFPRKSIMKCIKVCLYSVIIYLAFTINYPNKIRGAVGAVKYQSEINGDSMRKLAQSKPFGLRRRCVGCIPAGCRTVILRNRMYNSNGQTANRERQLAAPAGCRTVILRSRMYNSNGQTANRERRLCANLR